MEKPTQLTKSIGFFYVAKDNETKTSELSLLLSQKSCMYPYLTTPELRKIGL